MDSPQEYPFFLAMVNPFSIADKHNGNDKTNRCQHLTLFLMVDSSREQAEEPVNVVVISQQDIS